jgi:hypothetical protein
MKIVSRWNAGDVLYENSACSSMKELLEAAVKDTAYLQGANLRYANLQGANLRDANLRDANLQVANLRDAYLQGANLRDANLRDANLQGANLRDADLQGANLQGANLRDANLQGANLQDAYLQDAYLQDAYLQGAYLQGAYLQDAYLQGAYLQDALNIPDLSFTVVPSEGDIIVYKKLREGVCKLKIPAEAKRLNATGRKCRAEFAQVLELPEGCTVGHSLHDSSFEYTVGCIVKPKEPFCEDRWNECSSGIHFFITRKEAEDY